MRSPYWIKFSEHMEYGFAEDEFPISHCFIHFKKGIYGDIFWMAPWSRSKFNATLAQLWEGKWEISPANWQVSYGKWDGVEVLYFQTDHQTHIWVTFSLKNAIWENGMKTVTSDLFRLRWLQGSGCGHARTHDMLFPLKESQFGKSGRVFLTNGRIDQQPNSAMGHPSQMEVSSRENHRTI